MCFARTIPFVLTVFWALSATVAAAEPLVLSDWHGLVPDPAVEIDGAPSLVWAGLAETTTVSALSAPTDLSAYETISFQIHVEQHRSHWSRWPRARGQGRPAPADPRSRQ